MKIGFQIETSGKATAAVKAAKDKVTYAKETWRLRKLMKLREKLAKAEEAAREPRR